MEPLVH